MASNDNSLATFGTGGSTGSAKPAKETSNTKQQFETFDTTPDALSSSSTDAVDSAVQGVNNQLNKINNAILDGTVTLAQLDEAHRLTAEGQDLSDQATDILDKRNKAKLQEEITDALRSGSDEDLLEAQQDMASFNVFNKGVQDQIAEKDKRERDIFRETQRAQMAEEALALQSGALDRQQGAIDRDLAGINRQADQFQTDLTRERGLTRRAGRVAANSSQQANAQAANMQAQSGFGNSSAIQGAMASNRSASATKSGDILTGLTTLGFQEAAGLAGIADARANNLDARGGVSDARTRLDHAGREIGFRQESLLEQSDNLQIDFNRNVDFMREQFDLGVNMSNLTSSINDANIAYNEQQAAQASGFQTAIAGIGVGAAGFTGAPIIGGLIVAKGVADYFDF